MLPLVIRKSAKTLLAASLAVLALSGARTQAADAAKTQVAVRPEVLDAAGYGTQNYYLSDSGFGSQPSYTAPHTFPGGQPCNCPNCTNPNLMQYPFDNAPVANPYGTSTQDFLPTTGAGYGGYQPQDLQLNYTPGQMNPGQFGQPRTRDNMSYPANVPSQWCPTGTCPNQTYPNQGLPASTYPNPTYPNPTYPSGNWPFNNGSTLPATNPTWPTNPGNGYPQTPVYQPTVPSIPRQVHEEDIDAEITARYQNSEMLAFLNRMNVNQAMNLYVEASKMIDARHVNPASYEARTRRALQNLDHAVQNPAFLRAAGANPDPTRIAALRQELAQMAQATPARTANESLGLMQWAANLANQRLGVRQEAVALEFFNGSLDSLDKYTAFVPSKQAYGFNEDGVEFKSAALEENIVGVGIELKKHDQGALVLGTVENGPASRARILAGDVITGVDGRSVAGMSLSQIADMISGPAGSTVTLRIGRNGQEYTSSMRRESVYVSSVASVQMLDRETGYARLKQFSESSAEDLEKAMWKLHQGGMKSLVLDLRGNPGGLLTESIQVSDLFIPSGRIVATKGRTASDDSDERATFEKTWRMPLVVLVDENSASASEIFAAAIQENQRGVIVGRQSYGKGTVQTHFPLQSVTGNLKLTTAKFYSPSGREMEGQGVRPDVAVNGKLEDFLMAGLARDTDVQTAMSVMMQGTPAGLVANLAQGRPAYDISRLGN
jgi:carboxyl-terminal processing protease